MDLLSLLLKSMMSGSSVSALEKKSGVSSKLILKLLPLVLPILLKSMTANASSQSGAQSLLGALTQHNNRKPLPDQIGEADREDGAKIISHILGGNSASVVNQLGAETGMSGDQVNSVLASLAPALLSGVSAVNSTAGKAKKKQKKAAEAGKKIDLSDGLDASEMLQIFGSLSGDGAGSGSAGLMEALLGGGKQEQSSSNGSALLGALLGLK